MVSGASGRKEETKGSSSGEGDDDDEAREGEKIAEAEAGDADDDEDGDDDCDCTEVAASSAAAAAGEVGAGLLWLALARLAIDREEEEERGVAEPDRSARSRYAARSSRGAGAAEMAAADPGGADTRTGGVVVMATAAARNGESGDGYPCATAGGVVGMEKEESCNVFLRPRVMPEPAAAGEVAAEQGDVAASVGTAAGGEG